MPSDTLTIEDGEPITRQPRRDRAGERERRQEPREPEAIIESASGPSADDAVENSARQLAESNRNAANARREAAEATRREQAAIAHAQRASASAAEGHTAAIAGALEGAKAEQAAARLAMRAARDAGDFDAEMAASEAHSTAAFRVAQATAELASLKASAPPRQQQAPAPQASGRSPEAQRWLDEHPRFETDRVYRGTAIEAHNEAVKQGMPEGSQAYVDHIENVMRQEFGDNHGAADPQQRSQPMNRPSASGGVPPSRGGGGSQGSNGGFRDVKTELHKDPILVARGANGGMRIKFRNMDQQRDFQEGADTCKMSLEDYTLDHIRIAEERAAGGTGDLIGANEGNRYE